MLGVTISKSFRLFSFYLDRACSKSGMYLQSLERVKIYDRVVKALEIDTSV